MASKPRIEIRASKDDKKYVSVVAGNNRKIVTSETYNSNAAVTNAVRALKAIIPKAEVVDKTAAKQPSKKKQV